MTRSLMLFLRALFSASGLGAFELVRNHSANPVAAHNVYGGGNWNMHISSCQCVYKSSSYAKNISADAKQRSFDGIAPHGADIFT